MEILFHQGYSFPNNLKIYIWKIFHFIKPTTAAKVIPRPVVLRVGEGKVCIRHKLLFVHKQEINLLSRHILQ